MEVFGHIYGNGFGMNKLEIGLLFIFLTAACKCNALTSAQTLIPAPTQPNLGLHHNLLELTR